MVCTTIPYSRELFSIFDSLMKKTVKELKNNTAISNTTSALDLEDIVCDTMSDIAAKADSEGDKMGIFKNSILKISGQKFPDIIANKYFGVEVKSTKSDKWISTGSSIAEGTRLVGVEHIYILFAKLGGNIDFATRPYGECLYDVVVTHSPRYLIDMKIKVSESFFSKIKSTYNDFRKLDTHSKINKVEEYYFDKKRVADVWWIRSSSKEDQRSFRFYQDLNKSDKTKIKVSAFVLFPEIFSHSSDKYKRLASWLVSTEKIYVYNLRDLFTAGGKKVISDKRIENVAVSKIFFQLFVSYKELRSYFLNIDLEDCKTSWKDLDETCNPKSSHEALKVWKNLLVKYASDYSSDDKKILNQILDLITID